MTEQFPAMPVPALRAVRSMRPLHAARCVRPLDVWLPWRVRCDRVYALIKDYATRSGDNERVQQPRCIRSVEDRCHDRNVRRSERRLSLRDCVKWPIRLDIRYGENYQRWLTATLALLAACQPRPETAYDVAQPRTAAVRNIGNFNEALRCMDDHVPRPGQAGTSTSRPPAFRMRPD